MIFSFHRYPLLAIGSLALLAGQASAQIVGGPGPSTMSRGGNASGMRGSELVDFTFYGGVTGFYDTGILQPNVDSNGNPSGSDQAGYGLNFGAYGSHAWRRSSVGVDYRGDVRRSITNNNANNVGLNGTDQALGVEFRRILTRKWEIVGREAAGTTNRPFGGFSAPSYISTDTISVPLTEVYNNRVYYTQTSAYASYSLSSRTLFSMGGGDFRMHRSSQGLVSANGTYAVGTMQRRLSRKMSVSGGYQFMRYTYPRAFGDSNIHSVNVGVERNLGRYSALQVSIGVYRLETLGSQTYTLNPEVAAILGRPTGVAVLYRVNYLTSVNATYAYRKRNWGYTGGYTRGASPGNGVYLTSQNEAFSVGASYSGLQKISFGANASYTRMVSVFQTAEPFHYSQVGGGFAYNLGHHMNFVAQADFRDMTAGLTVANRKGFSAVAGFSFSSSSLPLSLW